MTARKYKVTRRIKLPQLQLVPGNEYAVKIIGDAQLREVQNDGKAQSLHIARVIDLDTGTECEMVCRTVLYKILTEEVVDYVGRCFLITPGDVSEGKDWRHYYVDEIEDPEESFDD